MNEFNVPQVVDSVPATLQRMAARFPSSHLEIEEKKLCINIDTVACISAIIQSPYLFSSIKYTAIEKGKNQSHLKIKSNMLDFNQSFEFASRNIPLITRQAFGDSLISIHRHNVYAKSGYRYQFPE